MGGASTGGSKAGDVRAGGAFYEILGKDNLTKVLDKLQLRVKGFAAFMSKAGTVAAAAGLGLVAPLATIFASGINRVAGIQRMADRLNVPIEQLSRLQHAAEVAGVELDEVLANPARFRDLIQSAPVIDAEAGRRAVDVSRQFNAAVIALKNSFLPLLEVLVPAARVTSQFVQSNAAALPVIAAAGAGLVAFGVAMKAGSVAILAGVVAVKALILAVGLLKVALVFGPEVLAAGGIALLVSQVFDLKTGFVELFDTAKKTVGGIVDALSTGDLALAARVGLAGITLEWTKAILFWTEKWIAFKNLVVDGWHSIGDVIEEAIAGWAAGWVWMTKGHAEAKQFLDGLDRNLAQMRAQRDADNRAFRGGQLAEAQGAVDAAKAALDARLGQAAEAADKARFEDEMRRRDAGLNLGAGLGAVKGSFATPQALLQFGIGEQVSMQAKIFGALKENLPVIAKEITILNQRFKLQ